jgi:uncharacterized protein (DUF488 family)
LQPQVSHIVKIVYTIGYEGTDIERFIKTLKAVGVKTVVDVRAVAVSRKKGFSKTALQSRLDEEGIGYTHFVELGDPKPGRDAARAGQYDAFRKIYSRHLVRAASKAALTSLSGIVSTMPTCLLCFERDPETCHRSLIATKFSQKGVKILHLYADDPDRYVRNASKLQGHCTRQSASAA